jgi:hypothetical protein
METSEVVTIVISCVSLLASGLAVGRVMFRTEVGLEHQERTVAALEGRAGAGEAVMSELKVSLQGMSSELRSHKERLDEKASKDVVNGVIAKLEAMEQSNEKQFEKLEIKLDRITALIQDRK